MNSLVQENGRSTTRTREEEMQIAISFTTNYKTPISLKDNEVPKEMRKK
jgi:hypothetical protein